MKRTLVVLSLAISSAIIFIATYQNHNSTEVRNMSIFELLIPITVVVTILGGPWFLAFFSASRPNSALHIFVFSLLAIIIAVYIAPTVRSSPAEGIGWYIIIYSLSVWALYPITWPLRLFKIDDIGS
jgi:hypothetical protein